MCQRPGWPSKCRVFERRLLCLIVTIIHTRTEYVTNDTIIKYDNYKSFKGIGYLNRTTPLKPSGSHLTVTDVFSLLSLWVAPVYNKWASLKSYNKVGLSYEYYYGWHGIAIEHDTVYNVPVTWIAKLADKVVFNAVLVTQSHNEITYSVINIIKVGFYRNKL